MSRRAFDRLSFLAIGGSIRDVIARLPDETTDGETSGELEPLFYEELGADFGKSLDGLVEKVGREVDQHIPCELFHADQGVPAFSVGPVDFRPRADWIDCFVKDPETRNIVERVERRELTIEEVRRQSSEPEGGRAARDAMTVNTFLRGFSWVGTARTEGHEFGQSHWKTSILVGLAIDAMGLRFHPEEARRFMRAGRGRVDVEDRLATSVDDGMLLHGWSAHVPGLGSAPGELAKRMREECKFLVAAGRILEVFVKHRQEGAAPLLVERWVNALNWTGEARREASDAMAVVKYGCALDGLSGGEGNSGAISEFAEAAFGPTQGDERGSRAPSVADVVEMVYGEARSGLAHGGKSGLLEDFSDVRSIGDLLLASLFYPVTLALAEFIEQESPAPGLGRNNAYKALRARLKGMRARGL